MLTLDLLYERVKSDLEAFSRCRKDAVDLGAETPMLAALLVQKYGYGLDKVLALAAELADHPAPRLQKEVDRLVGEIDPHWRENFKLRINARPATLVLTPPGPEAL